MLGANLLLPLLLRTINFIIGNGRGKDKIQIITNNSSICIKRLPIFFPIANDYSPFHRKFPYSRKKRDHFYPINEGGDKEKNIHSGLLLINTFKNEWANGIQKWKLQSILNLLYCTFFYKYKDAPMVKLTF